VIVTYYVQLPVIAASYKLHPTCAKSSWGMHPVCRCSFLVVAVAYGFIVDAAQKFFTPVSQTLRFRIPVLEMCVFLTGLPVFIPCKDPANAISYGPIHTHTERLLITVNRRRMSQFVLACRLALESSGMALLGPPKTKGVMGSMTPSGLHERKDGTWCAMHVFRSFFCQKDKKGIITLWII